ncbi:hypothetical protein EDB85DRAFT_2147463 [Lactarius pseudohatsudake]|nr:hypothetical protein EDB85DRAFT_2147463 [Lactarius pseudohatsudake]
MELNEYGKVVAAPAPAPRPLALEFRGDGQRRHALLFLGNVFGIKRERAEPDVTDISLSFLRHLDSSTFPSVPVSDILCPHPHGLVVTILRLDCHRFEVLLIAFSTYRMAASFENVYSSFDGSFTATLSCKVFCDVLITVGMTYTLMSNRTHVRRTNDVLNTLAIYAINCGSLHLVFAITSLILVPFHFFAPPSRTTFDSPSRTKFARFPNTLIYTTPSFVMVRLSLCAFMAILNSRDHLRETLDRPDGVVVVSLTQTSGRGPQPGAPACETPPSKETPAGQPSRSVFPQFRFPSTRRSEKTASYLLTETNSTNRDMSG